MEFLQYKAHNGYNYGKESNFMLFNHKVLTKQLIKLKCILKLWESRRKEINPSLLEIGKFCDKSLTGETNEIAFNLNTLSSMTTITTTTKLKRRTTVDMNFNKSQKFSKIECNSRGMIKQFVACFVYKLTKLSLIIIYLMSFFLTTTQLMQQVHCQQLANVTAFGTTTTTKINALTTVNKRKQLATTMCIFEFMPKNTKKQNYEIKSKAKSSKEKTKLKRNKHIQQKQIITKKLSNRNSQYYNIFKCKVKSLTSKLRNISSISYSTLKVDPNGVIMLREEATTERSKKIDDNAFDLKMHAQLENKNLTATVAVEEKAALKTFATYVQPIDNIWNIDVVDYAGAAFYSNIDKAKLARVIMDGLGLDTLPDIRKANISQLEYRRKYQEYLERVQRKKVKENNPILQPSSVYGMLQLLSIVTNNSTDITHKRRSIGKGRTRRDLQLSTQLFIQRRRQRHTSKKPKIDKTNILLQFPLNSDAAQLDANAVEEANIRLMLMYSPLLAAKRSSERSNQSKGLCKDDVKLMKSDFKSQISKEKKINKLNLKVFHILAEHKRELLDNRKIELEAEISNSNLGDETHTQWLEFDVSKAVQLWLGERSQKDLLIELQCDNCKRIGARILNDVSSHLYINKSNEDYRDEQFQLMPVLNIIGRGAKFRQLHAINDNNVHLVHHHRHSTKTAEKRKNNNNCYKPHQRCCRRRLDVVFKELKGFEFIIQPKVFDAGYCQGRCPPRHNPAHHHALLQSLIWKQDHRRAPKPCCAPSKLVELEILHVDEKDSRKLKISTWSDMQVVECACT